MYDTLCRRITTAVSVLAACWSLSSIAADELRDAACAGDGALVNEKISTGTPVTPAAMICAMNHRSIRMVELFLDHGFSIEQTLDIPKGRPLHYAVSRRDLSMVELLLQRGADANAPSALGTPLLRSLNGRSNPIAILERLLEHGADPNLASPLRLNTPPVPPLLVAVAPTFTRAEVVRLLINHGAQIHTRDPANGRTAAFIALSAPSGSPEQIATLEVLSRAGADFYALDDEGALPFTRYTYSRTLLSALARIGVDVTRVDARGENALFHVGCDDSIEFLATQGAAFDLIRRSDGTGLAHYFSALCRFDVADQNGFFRTVLSSGADMSQGDHQGLTPAMHAAKKGSIGTLGWLMELGSDPKLQDHTGKTLLHYLATAAVDEPALSDLLDVIERAGVDFNAGDIDGSTPMILAASAPTEYGSYVPIMLLALADHKASLKHKNRAGQTACDLATVYARRTLINLGGCL